MICALALLPLALGSCASAASRSSTTLQLVTVPAGASYTTSMGHAGETPDFVTIPSGKADLEVSYTLLGHHDGRAVAKSNLSPWVIGNALFGIPGLLGILIDVTGEAGWVHGPLPPVTLVPLGSTGVEEPPTFPPEA